jgi:hypothetical protein
MSIRQHRLDSIDKIREKIGELIGTKITLVLSDSTAVFGQLKEVQSDAVVVMNGRLKKNSFNFSVIKELYFDQIV